MCSQSALSLLWWVSRLSSCINKCVVSELPAAPPPQISFSFTCLYSIDRLTKSNLRLFFFSYLLLFLVLFSLIFPTYVQVYYMCQPRSPGTRDTHTHTQLLCNSYFAFHAPRTRAYWGLALSFPLSLFLVTISQLLGSRSPWRSSFFPFSLFPLSDCCCCWGPNSLFLSLFSTLLVRGAWPLLFSSLSLSLSRHSLLVIHSSYVFTFFFSFPFFRSCSCSCFWLIVMPCYLRFFFSSLLVVIPFLQTVMESAGAAFFRLLSFYFMHSCIPFLFFSSSSSLSFSLTHVSA